MTGLRRDQSCTKWDSAWDTWSYHKVTPSILFLWKLERINIQSVAIFMKSLWLSKSVNLL